MYIDTIKRVSESLTEEKRWWPYYFYHYSDVNNIVNILSSGTLLSRKSVKENNLMVNENASVQVINLTEKDILTYARLYFRPKTPTQYHNEGYKPSTVREPGIDACCPVPVFILFDAEKILKLPKTKFSEKGLAGKQNQFALLNGEEAFDSLPFNKIFHDGIIPESEKEIKKYRMAEVLYPEQLNIEGLVKGIVCRSKAEQQTLLYLLSKRDFNVYKKYKSVIYCKSELNLFYKNGIFVEEIITGSDYVFVRFNTCTRRISQTNTFSAKILIEIKLNWLKGKTAIAKELLESELDYFKTEGIKILLHKKQSKALEIEISFDGNLMYKNEALIQETEIY